MFSFFVYIIIGILSFMMASMYKYSTTSISFLTDFVPTRIHRWFWILTTLGILICLYLSYKTVMSLQQVGVAEDKLLVYNDNQQMLSFFINMGFIIMIIASNLSSLFSRKLIWQFYIVTFFVYASFAIMNFFFLEDTMFNFKKLNQLWEGEINFSSFKGYLTLLTSAILCFGSALIIRWGLVKEVD
jgi:hypothetical protein